ncbi:hypothetical protein V6N12_032838 [Hibiscus sabdariffa]|uniref:Uncharacterized protein n=1 Tax=Hibiscus sabdariffa TaxID=183260 RepID=A0ABR2AI89_9ROSI
MLAWNFPSRSQFTTTLIVHQLFSDREGKPGRSNTAGVSKMIISSGDWSSGRATSEAANPRDSLVLTSIAFFIMLGIFFDQFIFIVEFSLYP